MNITFFTIVLDGMPWIAHHLPVFNSLPKEINWTWRVVEGVADAVRDTRWCKRINPRLSRDGTSEYLRSISSHHPQVHYTACNIWHGKTDMVNYALQTIGEPGLLWEIDADELWTADQIVRASEMMVRSNRNCADFKCRYFVGQNLVVDPVRGTWTNDWNTMWRRLWKFEPGMVFASHEPPVISGQVRNAFTVEDTEQAGLVFDHYAYVTEQQLEFKQEYYGYAGAVDGWKRLQTNTVWPAKLKNFFPWVKDETTCRPLYHEH